MRMNIHHFQTLAYQASLRGNSMFLSLPITYKVAFAKAYKGAYGATIPTFLKLESETCQ